MKKHIPATVPSFNRGEYLYNWRLATKNTGNLMLFAGDQKIEHLNNDFYGSDIDLDDANPEHLFKIASKADIGVFAAQLGLIANYADSYRNIPYIIKLNSKTDLVPLENDDPYSAPLATFEQIIDFKKYSKLKIVGIGYTIYPGSKYEAKMLSEAAQAINNAHKHGLLAILWIYPRGKAIKNERDSHLIAGCAGIAASLGADFVKLNYPKPNPKSKDVNIKEIILAAGRTGVIFSGGSAVDPKSFLKTLAEQIKAGASGNATGRNIHQHKLEESINFANAISSISIYNKPLEEAYKIYTGKKDYKKQLNLNLRLR